MSVDFYECDVCEESKYEGNIYWCAKCQRSVCISCKLSDSNSTDVIWDKDELEDDEYGYLCYKYGKEFVDEEIIETGYLNPECCPFCNGDLVHDEILLEFALFKLKINKEELVKEYKKYVGSNIND